MNKNDGGAAFPTTNDSNQCGINTIYHDPGMSLRDYFAGQALAGLLSNQGDYSKTKNPTGFENFEHVAILSFQYADAMLEEREK